MATYILYGSGGFNANLPNNNIIEEIEVPDPEPTEEELARASALAKLAALGLTEAEVTSLIGAA